MKKKWAGYALTGALSLSLIGGTAFKAMAAEESGTGNAPASLLEKAGQVLDDSTKAKVQAIMDKMKEELAAIGVELPAKREKEDLFANLDEETKAKAQAIQDQVMAGSLAREEANEQLKALGITLPDHHGKGGPFADLGEETKAKVQAIQDKVKDGSLTRDEANEQLKALGITLPGRHGKGDPFADLDEETKAKAGSIMDSAKEELEELGVEKPLMGGHKF
ncbi:hypothetical protein B14911_18750 [Bacillus sp. NRRL B-14911]|jgi:hypothetical protein|uniref:Uncharacterized protein n=1 Tax=Bacillus infantis NRRL B-14911 TaxID=1367477 RepID=U5L563_9BACI|nr:MULTISPECIES: hypothetical protein [Bacillus]AGX02428.1 hypothetical protein N288_02305 [Bacillus infantis NRRL B-14911]EAR67463.1 hypothetical protein B14911_18750 [Bacillus sp. NRRL B-14911]PLR70798.1 hypothetical protein CYJ37_22560 [Bacillus sp. UMB0728]